jgi:hypothetical protein
MSPLLEAQACVTPTRIEILERDKHRTKSDIRLRAGRVSAAETHGAFGPLIVRRQYF